MATTTKSRGIDPNLITSRMFAPMLQAFMECSAEVQGAIREMVAIVNDTQSPEDEREMAIATIAEAMFPSNHGGHLGVDLEAIEDQVIDNAMDREEADFADRVGDVMSQRGMSQADLAATIGVGQPAVSMMLGRRARPQRRTVEKIAKALGVSPEELWPSIAESR